MNHEQVCDMWVAFNTGADRLVTTVGRRSTKRSVTMRVKPEARGSRISYRGDTIYSYHWWPFARFVRNERGEQAVLYRGERYSNSTSGHQCDVRQALGRLGDLYLNRTFTLMHEPVEDHAFNLRAYQDRLRVRLEKAMRARTRVGSYVEQASAIQQEMERYAAFFDVPVPAWSFATTDAAKLFEFETKLMKWTLANGETINTFWRRTT